MRVVAILVVGVMSALLLAAAVWFAITGRNLPGILGRGYTSAGTERLKRAPAIYFRALGLFVGIAALDGFFLTWVISLLPAPSISMIDVVATVIFVLAVPTTAAGVWLFVLASRYGMFRWDKR